MTERHEHDENCGHEMRLRTVRGDPSVFPRSVEVADPEMHLTVTQVEHLAREVEMAQARLRAAIGRHMATFEDLWIKLHELHPAIDPPSSGGAAFVRYQGKLYYVSWDDEEPPFE